MAHKAVVVGGSGLIGRLLINLLLKSAEYNEVVSLGRKKITSKNNRLTQHIVDFNSLDSHADLIDGDVVFCCLGSTRKKTPDLDEYRIIDHDYPVKLAEIAHSHGASQFHLVSALGANKNSSNFYSKMKGETEEDIKAIGLKCLFIYQPSLLTGHRHEQRSMERIAIVMMAILNPFLIGSLRKYRSIPAETVAKAMYKQSLQKKKGVHIYTSDKIKKRT
ncbi:MAG: oxidoreductase [Mucilaginibacter sp.]